MQQPPLAAGLLCRSGSISLAASCMHTLCRCQGVTGVLQFWGCCGTPWWHAGVCQLHTVWVLWCEEM